MNINEIDIVYLSFLLCFILFWLSPFVLSFIVSKIATRKRKKFFPDEIKKNKDIVFAYPIFFSNLPTMVRDFIKNNKNADFYNIEYMVKMIENILKLAKFKIDDF